MQEIYTMIQNTGVTLVIVVIFLWQYINDIKEQKEYKKEDRQHLKNIDENVAKLVERKNRS